MSGRIINTKIQTVTGIFRVGSRLGDCREQIVYQKIQNWWKMYFTKYKNSNPVE